MKTYRKECREAFEAAGVPALRSPVRISLEFYLAPRTLAQIAIEGRSPCRYRPRDVDNAVAAMKAALDSLPDAGVIRADSRRHVELGAVRLYSQAHEHRGRACVVVTIEERV